jgi:phage FluMu protein Com
MFTKPKCPRCEVELSKLDGKRMVVGDQFGGAFWYGVVATCPYCKTVVGVSVDMSDALQQIAAEMVELRKLLGPSRLPE